LQRWDVNNPEVNPGGIWNAVTLIVTGPGAIRDLQLQPVILELPEGDLPQERAPAALFLNVTLAGFPETWQGQTGRLVASLRNLGEVAVLAETSLSVPALPGEHTWALQLELAQARPVVHLGPGDAPPVHIGACPGAGRRTIGCCRADGWIS
jgi:hypothetical protein